jgi:hypothetical protein
MTPEALTSLEAAVLEHIPGFSIRYKDESNLMKILGQLTRLFNPRFMSDFTTTWGSKVYFPNRAAYSTQSRESFITLAHEFVHLWDGKQHGLGFRASYSIPQIFALVLLLIHVLLSPWPSLVLVATYAFVSIAVAKASAHAAWGLLGIGVLGSLVLSAVLTGWGALLFAGGVAALGPWPSKNRTKWELRGYGMNIALYTWSRNRVVEDVVIEGISKQFTGPNYWFMSRNAVHVQSSLRATSMRALAGNFKGVDETPYSVVHRVLVEHQLVRPY